MTKERLEDIYGENKGTVTVGGKKYYFKRNDAYVELLAEQIAELFQLKHAHYETVKVGGDSYYLSKDLNDDGSFATAQDFGIIDSHIKVIEDFICMHFPQQAERLIEQLMKMFFMDLLVLNVDRSNDNWGFLLTPDGVINICVLDNDLSFIHETSVMTSLSDNYYCRSFEEIRNIFETFPEEYINMFIEMYDLLDLKKLEEIIKLVEEKIGMKLPYKNNYYGRYYTLREKIKGLIEEKKHNLMV